MTDDIPDPDDLIETSGGPPADPSPDAAERQRHIDLINDQLDDAECVEWDQLSLSRQRVVIEHGGTTSFTNLLASLREDGWVPAELDVGESETTLIAEKEHDLENRITLTVCDDCGEDTIAFGDRVEGRGLASGKRIYCTDCGAEWTVSFKVNNCERGCCPFDREVVLDPIHSEEQKIGPASDEFDSITLVRGLDPDAKIEFYQQTRPEDKIDLYESVEDAPDVLADMLQKRNDTDAVEMSFEDRVERWEERLAELDDA